MSQGHECIIFFRRGTGFDRSGHDVQIRVCHHESRVPQQYELPGIIVIRCFGEPDQVSHPVMHIVDLFEQMTVKPGSDSQVAPGKSCSCSREQGNTSPVLVKEHHFPCGNNVRIIHPAEFTGGRHENGKFSVIRPILYVGVLKNPFMGPSKFTPVAYIIDHQRSLCNSLIDGIINLGIPCTSRGRNLLIGIKINFINIVFLADLPGQYLGIFHKAVQSTVVLIVSYECDHISPVGLHRIGI